MIVQAGSYDETPIIAKSLGGLMLLLAMIGAVPLATDAWYGHPTQPGGS